MRCYRHVRVKHFYTNSFCIPLDIKVSKTKPSELRLNLSICTIRYNNKTLRMLVGKVQLTIRQDFLRKSYRDFFSFWRINLNHRHAGCIYSAVVAISYLSNRKYFNPSINRTICYTIFFLIHHLNIR